MSILLGIILALFPIIGISSEVSFVYDPDTIEVAIKSILFIGIYDTNDEYVAIGSGFIAFNSQTIIIYHHVIDGADTTFGKSIIKNCKIELKHEAALLNFT